VGEGKGDEVPQLTFLTTLSDTGRLGVRIDTGDLNCADLKDV